MGNPCLLSLKLASAFISNIMFQDIVNGYANLSILLAMKLIDLYARQIDCVKCVGLPVHALLRVWWQTTEAKFYGGSHVCFLHLLHGGYFYKV